MIHKNKLIFQIPTTTSWIRIGVLAAIVFLYLLIVSSFNFFPGDEGDSRLIAFILEHLYSWVYNNSTFSYPTFFYPATGTLGFNDLQLLHAAVYSLIRVFDVPVLKSFSITIFVLNTCTYIASFCFIRFGMKLNLFPSMFQLLREPSKSLPQDDDWLNYTHDLIRIHITESKAKLKTTILKTK